MKTQLLIATSDCDYAGHLSNILSEHHADALDVSTCSTAESLREHLTARSFDVALLEASMIDDMDLRSINLPLLLWPEDENIPGEPCEFKKIRKYQRISSIVSNVLELYSKESANERGSRSKKARITAVWSPAGGVGKTAVALAYSAGKVLEGKQVLYLDLEQFSSVGAYFAETGRSISAIFEMLEAGEGNIQMLIRSLRQRDGGSGITYFCRPENFDDMNILTADNVSALIDACAGVTDELVIDMSDECGERTRKAFELADRILLVTDPSRTAQIKFSQFAAQHNIFQHIKGKSALVANRGAAACDSPVDEIIYLPAVQSGDAAFVYKALSGISFGGVR